MNTPDLSKYKKQMEKYVVEINGIKDHYCCPPKYSPCGIEGEHRCCLCGNPVDNPNQEK